MNTRQACLRFGVLLLLLMIPTVAQAQEFRFNERWIWEIGGKFYGIIEIEEVSGVRAFTNVFLASEEPILILPLPLWQAVAWPVGGLIFAVAVVIFLLASRPARRGAGRTE